VTVGQTDSGHSERPFTDATCARLAMSYEACELAELARLAVPIGGDELHPDGTASSTGSALAEAVRVLEAAYRHFDAVVVFARLGGAGWQLIGDTVGFSAHAARERFEAAETRFREALRAPVDQEDCAGAGMWWRNRLTREPAEAALDLDEWVLRHLDGEDDPGPAPVSGNLI
jgi:hypothetical protein